MTPYLTDLEFRQCNAYYAALVELGVDPVDGSAPDDIGPKEIVSVVTCQAIAHRVQASLILYSVFALTIGTEGACGMLTMLGIPLPDRRCLVGGWQ